MNNLFQVFFYVAIMGICITIIPIILQGLYIALCVIYRIILAIRYGLHKIAINMAIQKIKDILKQKNQNEHK